MSLKKICIFSLTTLLLSAPSIAQNIPPLANQTLGCFSKSRDNAATYKEVVVLRVYQGLNFWGISGKNEGQVIVLEGIKSTYERGITGGYLTYEGTQELVNYPGEDWTYQAPASTFFTARGNLRGIFLGKSSITGKFKALYVKFGSTKPTPLECTDDEALLKAKVISVLKLQP